MDDFMFDDYQEVTWFEDQQYDYDIAMDDYLTADEEYEEN